MSQQPKNIKLDARLQRRLKRAEIREKILNKQAKKNKKIGEEWGWMEKTNKKKWKDYCEKATHEMQQAEDVKKVIEHCYQKYTHNLIDIKLVNHHLKKKNLVIMSLQEVKENEERRKEIEIYRSNIWNIYNMIKRDLYNDDSIPLVKTVMDHLKHVHKILGCTIWPNPIPQHVFQSDV